MWVSAGTWEPISHRSGTIYHINVICFLLSICIWVVFNRLLQIKSVWLAMRSFCMDMGFPYHRWHCSFIILEETAALKASQYSEILKRLFCKQSFHAEWEPGLSPFLLYLALMLLLFTCWNQVRSGEQASEGKLLPQKASYNYSTWISHPYARLACLSFSWTTWPHHLLCFFVIW